MNNYIIGAGGHARVVFDVLKKAGIPISAFIDEKTSINTLYDLPVLHETVVIEKEDKMIIGIGDNKTRKLISNRINASFLTAIDPSATIGSFVTIAEGTVCMPKSVINIETTIGKHCIINTGVCIDHECVLEDYVHVSPNATLSGRVKVGEGSWIGAGAVIKQGVEIGKNCVIGAGSVVLKNISDNQIFVGNPAKFLKPNE